jgi:hypothetical protein
MLKQAIINRLLKEKQITIAEAQILLGEQNITPPADPKPYNPIIDEYKPH